NISTGILNRASIAKIPTAHKPTIMAIGLFKAVFNILFWYLIHKNREITLRSSFDQECSPKVTYRKNIFSLSAVIKIHNLRKKHDILQSVFIPGAGLPVCLTRCMELNWRLLH